MGWLECAGRRFPLAADDCTVVPAVILVARILW
jgi:hypothetical protein